VKGFADFRATVERKMLTLMNEVDLKCGIVEAQIN
jgi:hypothetical protein